MCVGLRLKHGLVCGEGMGLCIIKFCIESMVFVCYECVQGRYGLVCIKGTVLSYVKNSLV